jgi:hypothetical protein
VVHFELAGCSFHDFLLDRALSDQPVNDDLLLLADPVRAVDRLQVNLGVPVAIKQNNDVGLMQIDAESSRTCRQNEHLLVRLWVLEVLNAHLSVIRRGLSINAAVLVASVPEEVVKDVQQSRHLTENEHFKLLLQQFGQQKVEHFELLAGRHQVVAVQEGRAWLYIVEQVGVVANLFQLHQHIEQFDFVLSLALTVYNVNVA